MDITGLVRATRSRSNLATLPYVLSHTSTRPDVGEHLRRVPDCPGTTVVFRTVCIVGVEVDTGHHVVGLEPVLRQLVCIYDPGYAGRTLSTSTHSCTGTGHLDSTTTVGQTTKMPNAMKLALLFGVQNLPVHGWRSAIRGGVWPWPCIF